MQKRLQPRSSKPGMHITSVLEEKKGKGAKQNTTCAIVSVSLMPLFALAVECSFGVITHSIRTAIVSSCCTFVDI